MVVYIGSVQPESLMAGQSAVASLGQWEGN